MARGSSWVGVTRVSVATHCPHHSSVVMMCHFSRFPRAFRCIQCPCCFPGTGAAAEAVRKSQSVPIPEKKALRRSVSFTEPEHGASASQSIGRNKSMIQMSSLWNPDTEDGLGEGRFSRNILRMFLRKLLGLFPRILRNIGKLLRFFSRNSCNSTIVRTNTGNFVE